MSYVSLPVLLGVGQLERHDSGIEIGAACRSELRVCMVRAWRGVIASELWAS
jgi:hypothetical protein